MRIPAAALIVSTVTLAACGTENRSAPTGITAQAAKASVERSARLKLAPQDIPVDARGQGLRSAFSNAATVVRDRQAVTVFLMRDAEVADKVGELVRDSVPQPSRLIVNDNVMVVYAAAGKNRGAQVEKAVEAL